MGETQNTKVDGDTRMTMLCQHKKLDAKYKGKKFAELTAVDQQHIDMEYDKCMKAARSAPLGDVSKKELADGHKAFKEEHGLD